MADLKIVRFRGDTVPDEMSIRDATGAAFNITNYTFEMTLNRRRRPSGIIDQVYSITGIITSTVNATVEFRPSNVQADQVPGAYYYDIQMIDPLNRRFTIAKGNYIYTQDITKT